MRGKNKILRSLLWLLPVVVIVSCQEIYDPRVTADEEILVVDGLLTDAGMCRVTLSLATPYDEPEGQPVPVYGAAVTVLDNDSAVWDLRESGQGVYDASSLPVRAGHTYTLVIRSEGEEYRSTPQRMMPSHTLDTIYGESAVKEYPFTGNSGTVYYHYYKGGSIHLGYRDLPDSAKSFRLVYSLYVQYVAMDEDQLIPPSYYIWSREEFPTVLSITGSDFPVASGEMLHDLCFFPFDARYYGFDQRWPYPPYVGGMNAFVLMIDQYRLNRDAEEYYAAMKKLLEAEGKMFDPIASRLPRNISCTSQPKKKVTGFFEVSSLASYAFQVMDHGIGKPLTFKETPSLRWVPKYGYLKNEHPPFWVSGGH